MANVEHSALTGANLHEPKGVAAAAANLVYVSDGAASGDWAEVTLDVLADTAKAFQAQLLHTRDSKSSNSDGGTFTSGAWRTRTLNSTPTNEISGASVSSNQVTLPAGTYFILAWAPAFSVNNHQTRLRNMTDGSTTLSGLPNWAASNQESVSFLAGRFTIADTKAFELQHQAQSSATTTGFGVAAGFGESEIYSQVLVWKIA
jgi:hypothetical protein